MTQYTKSTSGHGVAGPEFLHMFSDMPRAQRRIVASFVLMAFLAFWVWGAATIGTQLANAPKWATLFFFIVAGFGWVFPLKPVFGWMNSGPEDKS